MVILDCHISKSIFGNFIGSTKTGCSLLKCALFHFNLNLVCEV